MKVFIAILVALLAVATDLVPLTVIANPPQAIVVNPTRVKVDNFNEFLDYARKNPEDILDRMHSEVVKAISTPELREIWANQGSESTTMTCDQFAKLLNSDINRWA